MVELTPDYLHHVVRVRFDAETVTTGQLRAEIARAGFDARQLEHPGDVAEETASPVLPKWTTLAGCGLLCVAAFASEPASDVLAIAAAGVAAIPIARAAGRAIGRWRLDMNALMTIAACGAVVIGEHFEAATAMCLFGIANWLETLSMARARGAVRSLTAFAPPTAHRLISSGTGGNGDSADDVLPETLEVGDLVLVKPGERIPIDGSVERGESWVNQAPITGESIPVSKEPGQPVYAGTLNGDRSLVVRVDRPASDSTLAHIGQLIRDAHASRSPTERFVDRFAAWYTPTVVALAVLIAVGPPLLVDASWSDWLHRALVLLVVACPCALVISTPVTIVSGIARAARRGILIKGGEFLEAAGRIDVVAFDKTGTLTRGELEVIDVSPSDGFTDEQVLAVAAGLESHSEHAIAAAVLRAATDRGVATPAVGSIESTRGLGVAGEIDGRACLAGSRRWLEENGVRFEDDLRNGPARRSENVHVAADATSTATIHVARDGIRLGAIHVRDIVRGDAADAIAELSQLGVRQTLVLTGDSTAEGIIGELEVGSGFEVRTQLLPEEKVAVVKDLSAAGRTVAMVGDGVNDAPALAAARVGVAFGSAASDTALETADAVILSPHVRRVPELLRLGRKCRRLLYQNITFALATKGAVLALAAFGLATMWMAVAADVGASLVVIANGMRLLGKV